MSEFFNYSEKTEKLGEEALESVKPYFERIEEISEYNQQKMLRAFIDGGVSETMFSGSTGYGYDDRGREVIDRVFAQAVGAEDALVRHNFTCGTHTLAVALFGVLRTGDTMLCVTGTPYDTIHSVIGINGAGEGEGSLKEYGINYKQVDLKDGLIDLEAIENAVDEKTTMVYIQRSRGYELRKSFSVSEIGEAIRVAKKKNKNVIVMVDNCYGEFTEKTEPVSVGADLMAGSLIKNPGAGIARTGGYIAGRHDLVERCAFRLTTPGLGREVGATLGMSRELFMGIYYAPSVVKEALKTAVFTSRLFELMGFEVTPRSDEERHDIIQAIKLEKAENLIAFCQGMQKGAPIDSFVAPEPSDMPGYDSKVIMSAGAFTLGSSIELSADGPLREPYAVWMQGGTIFYSAKTGILLAAEEVMKRNEEI